MPDEETPLLQDQDQNFWDFGSGNQEVDYHDQFCKLVGIPPSGVSPGDEEPEIGPKTLYGRALRLKRSQTTTYIFTAAISNSLLLSQVVIGAAVTALGASESSHILITIFGAMNTIIAGVVAYLKSRGQPMRARMYRDDLERVVDEIENSEIMWRGISKRMHGYQEIDIDKAVTVRSEVARLTRLYDRAVQNNTMNNPDMWMATGTFEGGNTMLRSRTTVVAGPPAPIAAPTAAPIVAQPVSEVPGNALPLAIPVIQIDPDESPATAPKPITKEIPKVNNDTGTDSGGSAKSNDDPKAGNEASKDDAPTNGKEKTGTTSSAADTTGDAQKGPEETPPPATSAS